MNYLPFIIIGSLFFSTTAFARQDTAFSNKPFTDVSATRSDFQAIEYLRTQNVVKGYLDGRYKPDASINRAEFVEFIINPLILDTNDMGACVKTNISAAATNVFFTDVSKDSWYAENICFAKTKQIVDGYPNGTFRPGATINFAEAAKIISNVFSIQIQQEGTAGYWYRPYVQSLSDLHAIPTGITRIGQTLTRGDMAEIVYRLKTDAIRKNSMGFDRATNSLYQRPVATPVVTAPPPTVVANTYDRPSRRSIVAEAERLNALRALQR
ncbi:MAG: S-layer homology domain-containing protein [Candidatus Peribacteraceae bacterium]|nr:S-layer homology domain-containing protein [Candidatus Peribacteraceae bacterium]